ncbi:MAG: hypothetical protein M1814_005951 [Vezdaea aestivalis]|nr:MAG: hypothetical protein M1814_005951 [Vezdaea aestivalis]
MTVVHDEKTPSQVEAASVADGTPPAYTPTVLSYAGSDTAFSDREPPQYEQSPRLSIADEKAPIPDPASSSPHPSNQAPISSSNPFSQPNALPNSTPSQGYVVPANSQLISHGFSYPAYLRAHNITPEQWAQFTAEIQSAARLESIDWVTTVGAGAGTFVIAGILIGWLAVVPAAFVGRAMHVRAEVGRVREARDRGGLEATVHGWNEAVFKPNGLLVRLDLPGERKEEIGVMEVVRENKWAGKDMRGCCGGKAWAKSEKCQAKWESKMAKWETKRASKEAKRASHRGRIAIVPIQSGPGLNEKSS